MASVPLFKLGILLVRTAAKPIASRLKTSAKNSPNLTIVCEQIGQGWHVVISRINIAALGHKVKQIKPLGQKEAIDSGADFIGEAFIYSVSAVAIIWEVRRNDKKSQKQKLEKLARQNEKQRRLREEDQRLRGEIEQLRKHVSEISQEQESLREMLSKIREQQLANGKKRWGLF